jgi:hypothetical protein
VTAVAWGVLAAGPALAQPQPVPRRVPPVPPAVQNADPQEKARYQIAVMESVLETAVQRGATTMTRQWRSVAPEMLMIGGAARARGFRLDGYGLFFAVDVPAMQRSVMWTWRMLDRDSSGATTAIQSLRNFIRSVSDSAQRRELEQAVRRLEVQVSPYTRPGDAPGQSGSPDTVAGRTQAGATAVTSTVTTPVVEAMEDPNEIYSSAVKSALIEAMLDYSQALVVGADESLTVAARDSNARGIGADEQGESMTIFIRIKGSDLQAFYAGRITRDEARKRVEVREY